MRVDLHRSTDLVVALELEEAINRLGPALQEMRAAVHGRAGIIYREVGDGIFAIFGAPVANDLHAVMACLAALDLLHRIEELNDAAIRVRIGVHSGQVVAGPRTIDFNSTYEFDGPPLIMADRLQSIAEPGQIVASANCRKLADGYIRFGPAVERSLKGFPSPVAVHVVEGVGELSKWRVNANRRATHFVGRKAEIGRVLDLADGAIDKGRGACIFIIGEAGVGKSRLALECIHALQTRDWHTTRAECSPILGQSPFSLLRAVITNVAESGADVLKSLRGTLPPIQVAALEVMLQENGGVDPAVWAKHSPQARGRAIVTASRALVAHRAKILHTVLFLEDMQWADEASGPALQAILSIAEQQPLLVLVTARSGELPTWLEGTAALTLSLQKLGKADGLAMLDHLLGSSTRLAPLKQRILDHTGGMPLFVEEVCRRLNEMGTLEGDWTAFEAGEYSADLGVPLTVQGVIASRIDGLAFPAKRMLQVAAAIGPHVSTQLMKAVTALSEGSFRQAVAALSGAAMLIPEPGLGDQPFSAFDFAHELVRQVAYDAVTGPDRIALHSKILTILEAPHENDLTPDLAGALAHHALSAHSWAKAADYTAAIARRSFSQFALPEATRHYERAMEALDRVSASPSREAKAIDLRIEARLAYANLGKITHWLHLAKEAEERSAAIGDDMRRVAALAVRAAALNFCGAPADALAVGAEAVDQAKSCGNPGWLAYAQYGLGQACYVAGQYRQGLEHFGQAHRRFAHEGATPPMGGSSVQAGLLCCMMACLCNVALGDEPAAAAMQRLADETAAKESHPFAVIAAGYSRGALLLHQGWPVAAEAALSQALMLATRHEVNLFVPVVGCQRGLALLLLGRTPEARQVLNVARAEAEALGHRSARLRADTYLALADAIVAETRSAALSAVQAVVRIARQHGYAPLEVEGLLLEAALHRVGDNVASAAKCADAAKEAATGTGASGTLRDFSVYVGRLLEPMADDC